MIKYILIIVVLIFTYNTSKSQNYFEELHFPDSTHVCSMVCNYQGDIFAAALSLI